MSTDEKDLELEDRPAIRRPRRVPVATANGNQASRANQESTTGRRKRVRITTSEPTHNRFPESGTRRFDYPTPSTEYRQQPYRGRNAQSTSSSEVTPFNQVDYNERYQTKRAEGNFNYNYNRTERVQNKQRAADSPGHGNKKKKNKKKIAKTIEPVKYAPDIDPTQEIRLNKYLANAGVCSRREADLLIERGEISVNGVVVTELGRRVTSADVVVYKENRVQAENKVYVLLNKPKNCVTTSDDPECRLTVMDLVRKACPERIYPVGRLDRHTTGVILITNDGDLSSKLTHPSFLKKKIYHVWLDKPVEMEDMQRIADGIELEDGEIHADAISYVKDDDLSQVGLEIHSGRNRIVRRIFEHLGYRVIKLDRVYFAGLTKKNLPRGKWRYLNEEEVNALRMGAFE